MSIVTEPIDPIEVIDDVQDHFTRETIEQAKELCNIFDWESSRREPRSIAAAAIYLWSKQPQQDIWHAMGVTAVTIQTARDSKVKELQEVDGIRRVSIR